MEKLCVKSRVLLSLLAQDGLPQDDVHIVIERIHVLDQRQPDTVAISMLPIFPSLSIPPGTMWCSQMMTLPPWEQRLRWLPLGAMVPPRFPRPVPPPGAPPETPGGKQGHGDLCFAPPELNFYAGVLGRGWKETFDRSEPPALYWLRSV